MRTLIFTMHNGTWSGVHLKIYTGDSTVRAYRGLHELVAWRALDELVLSSFDQEPKNKALACINLWYHVAYLTARCNFLFILKNLFLVPQNTPWVYPLGWLFFFWFVCTIKFASLSYFRARPHNGAWAWVGWGVRTIMLINTVAFIVFVSKI